MRTIRRTFANLSKSTLFLGRAGENLVTRLEINISKELNEFFDPVFEFVLKMPAYADPYPVLVTVQDNVLTYTFSGYDLSQSGNGELELLVCGQDGEVLKSTTAKTRIEQSIIPNAYPGPLQKVIDDIKAAIGEIEAKSGIKVVDELPETPDVDAVVYLDGVGIYHYTGTEWEQLTDNGTGLAELEQIVDAIRDDIPSSEDVARWDDAADKRHTHENKATLDRFTGDATSVQYNGYDVSLLPKDDVVLLGLHEYSDLVVRDDVINGETIQDVPFYTTDTIELVDTTSTYTHPDSVRVVRTVDNGYIDLQIRACIADHVYYYYSSVGWQDGSQEHVYPVFNGFTPNAYWVYRAGDLTHTDEYGSMTELPSEAKSLLRSFSQCINVSADAMGEIRYDPDAVEEFRGNEILPNHKYHLTIGEDFGIVLPTMDEPDDWSEQDWQFVIYLTCTEDVDVDFGNVRLIGGNAPNTDTGNHKIIGTFLRDEHMWAIGGIDYEEAT